MLTLEQLHAAQAVAPPGVVVPPLLQALRASGLVSYDYCLADGSFRYVGPANALLTTGPTEPFRTIAVPGPYSYLWAEQAVWLHQLGHTDHATFCQQLAAAGVAKWTVDAQQLTRIYYDVEGRVQVVEKMLLPTESFPASAETSAYEFI